MAAVFTEDRRARLKALTEGSKIDAAWIKGIRVGWKKLVDQTKKFEGRIESHERDLDLAREQVRAAEASLQNMKNYVQALRSDLLISKGFWTLPSTAGKQEINLAKRWKTKVVEELDKAEEAIGEGLSKLRHWLDAFITPPNDHHSWVGMYHKEISDREGFDRILHTIGGSVDEAVDAADAAISKRLFRHLSSLLSMSPAGPSGKKEPIDFGGIEPEVLHVGPFTVVFQDVPSASPARVGTDTTTPKGHTAKMKLGWKPSEKGEGYRSPAYRKHYAKYIKDAYDMLTAKGLGFIAKGMKIVVRPEGKAPDNHYDAALGVGGHYNRQTDTITIFEDACRHTAELLVHELGHRYWYKYMSTQDRENFGRWFEKVPAVSSYGGRHRREDFAELFKHYVVGRKMTKDQMQRFRQFMTGKRPRLEAIEESTATKARKCTYCDQPAAVSLILDGGDFVPVCQAHVGEGRRRCRLNDSPVIDVKQVEQGPIAYREHTFMPHARMRAALEPALAFVEDEEPGTYFGLQASPERHQSAFAEAPADPPPRAPIGRRDIPRGAVISTRTGGDIQGVTGQPIKRVTGKGLGKGTSGPERVIMKRDRTRQEIPDSLLQMLGTDWKTMRAMRVHDNRMTVTIDGVRYSVYTRRG